jgi:hypothetical protein
LELKKFKKQISKILKIAMIESDQTGCEIISTEGRRKVKDVNTSEINDLLLTILRPGKYPNRVILAPLKIA